MAWQIRSLAEASQRARGAFRQYMKGTDASLKNNFVTVTAKVLAGMAHEFELRMAYLSQQLFATTASAAFLARHGSDVGIFKKPAAAANGIILGEGSPGQVYPAGIRFISGEVIYLSTSSATASQSGALSVAVQSQSTGTATNRDADGILSLADPVLWPDLGGEWLVGTSGLGGGANSEDDESLKARILFRKRNPPGGGRLSDYEDAALSVPGVVKAWAFRQPLAPGFISVFFLFAGRPNLIPTSGDVAVVQAAIDAKRLIRIDDNVAVAPTPEPLDIIISGLAFDSADVRAAIEVSLAATLLERARPGVSGDTFTLSRSWLAEAVSRATGEDRHVLDWPLDDVTYTNGRYPIPGSVTYAA